MTSEGKPDNSFFTKYGKTTAVIILTAHPGYIVQEHAIRAQTD